MRVLFVGEPTRSTTTPRFGLKAEGFVMVCVSPGVEAVDQAKEHSFDVVILDVALRGSRGLGMLRQLRVEGVWTPVIVLSAGEGEHDETDALNHGADDYMKKPVALGVLVARLRALARRSAPERPVVLSVGTLTLDPVRHTVHRGPTLLDLTPREHGLLEYLMRNEDVVVTKADILQNVWDSQYRGAQNVVEVYVRYLRRKIDVPFGTNTIETIRGVGYRLLPAVLTAGSLSMDPTAQTVQRGSTPIGLSPREYALLEYFMRNKDDVLTRTDILRGVWETRDTGFYNVVEVYIGYLRRKIDIPFDTNTIETIRGAGYRLICEGEDRRTQRGNLSR